MNKVNLKYGLIALAGLGISANVNAADLSCSDVTFTPEAYATYEFIDKACLDVVERDEGGTFVKITARIVAQTSSGTHVRYRHADGDLGPSHKSNVPLRWSTQIGGKEQKLQDLAVRQDVNVYIPGNFWSVNEVEAAAAPVVAAAAAAPPPPPPAPEPEPEPEPEVLPTTASSLPLLALFGSLFLILGSALRLSRKQ
jgi:hypothetical protein